jgi:tetratricopeptide (TPR) repeat protein
MKAPRPVLTWILMTAGVLSAAQTPQAAPSKTNPSLTSQQLRSQLRQSQLAPLTEPGDSSGSRQSLKDLTEQLQRLQLPQLQTLDSASKKTENSPAPTDSQSSSRSASIETLISTAVENDKTKPQTKSVTPIQSLKADKAGPAKPVIADPVMAVLAANPQAVVDLFSAAEALFAKRDLARAAKLYQQVTVQMADNPQDQNHSWVLFQFGNCLRFSKTVEAAKLYDKVIADYPESDWAKVARARNSYIAWSQQAKPEELLTRYGYDPNSF